MSKWDAEAYLKKFNMTEWNAQEYLNKLYDKQLKNLRTKIYATLRDSSAAIITEEGWKYDVSEDKRGWLISKDEVMAELATRGDIPNVKEAKVIRQERAKRKF